MTTPDTPKTGDYSSLFAGAENQATVDPVSAPKTNEYEAVLANHADDTPVDMSLSATHTSMETSSAATTNAYEQEDMASHSSIPADSTPTVWRPPVDPIVAMETAPNPMVWRPPPTESLATTSSTVNVAAGDPDVAANAWEQAFSDPTDSYLSKPAAPLVLKETKAAVDFSARWQNGLSDTVQSSVEESLKVGDSAISSGLEQDRASEATADQPQEAPRRATPSDDEISKMQGLLTSNFNSLLQVKKGGHLVSIKLYRGH